MPRHPRMYGIPYRKVEKPHGIDEPPAVIDDGLGRVGFACEQTEWAGLKKGETIFVEEEPARKSYTIGHEDTRHLTKVIFGLSSQEMGEDRIGDDQREFPVIYRKMLCQPQAVFRRIRWGIDVMVQELKNGIDGRQMALAPINHCFVDVDSDVPARFGILLHQSAREPPAATAKIEDRVISMERKF